MREAILKGHDFDSEDMVVEILREIEARIQEDHQVKKLKGIITQMKSQWRHNSKRTVSQIERLELRQRSHPPDSPDISRCDL